MGDNKDVISSINWNSIIKLNARGIDRTNLGQVQGLFEPFVVVEKGTLNKETYYIPKSVIEKYDNEALYFRLTEQEVKDNCLRESPPSEEDAEKIRINAERIASTQRPIVLRSENQEEEVLRKLMEAISGFKETISSRTKWAKEKIEESQIQKDEQRISKMGELAAVFTDSFDKVMSEIKTTHTYAEQEQIYDGFIKLLEQQHELVSARKDLASKLKSSVTEPLLYESKMQNLDERTVMPMESTTQAGRLISPSNEAHNVSPEGYDNITKGKVEQENPFMVIEPPVIKYCKVSIKPSHKKKTNKSEKRKRGIPEIHLKPTPYHDE